MVTYTFSSGTKAKPSEVNKNFIDSEAPIGSIMAWLKSYTNTPTLKDGWVECNGQTLNDSDSPYDGQVIPDLNGDNRFMRGSSTSGSTGGAETINIEHRHTLNTGDSISYQTGSTTQGLYINNSLSSTQSILPKYYTVVWIMKVK